MRQKLVPWIVLAVVLPLQFVVMLVEGFRPMHPGLGDGRLVNYTLEHGYRWLAGDALHRDFWAVPIFWPAEGVSAYTDVMLGHGPIFWIWRWLGAAPDTAMQLWMLAIFALNFAAAYAMLARGLRLDRLASTTGAVLVLVGGVRWIAHIQLVPLYWVFLAILALLRIFDASDARPTPTQRRLWIAVFFVAAVAQVWSAVYPFFFFGMLAGFALVVALAFRTTRNNLLHAARRDAATWVVSGALAAAAAAPLVLQYLAVAHELGYRTYEAAAVARPIDWILLGPQHWFYGAWSPPVADGTPPPLAGAGPITLVIVIAGVVAARRRTSVLVLAFATLGFALVATRYGSASPWRLVHDLVPGAGGIRAPNRAILVLAPLVAIAVACIVDRLVRDRRFVIAAAIGLVAIGERASRVSYTDKRLVREHVARIAERIDPDCTAFYLVGTTTDGQWIAEDAAWAGLLAGKPTVNGRYGNTPAGYDLPHTPLLGDNPTATRAALDAAMRDWLEQSRAANADIQWIEITPLNRAWVHDVRKGRRTLPD